MGYVIVNDSKRTITWNDNPKNTQTYAVLTDTGLLEFVVQDENGVNIVLTKDFDTLSHLQTVIGELFSLTIS